MLLRTKLMRPLMLLAKVAVVAGALCTPLPGTAQEHDPFFPKDFAKDPLGKSLPGTRTPRAALERGQNLPAVTVPPTAAASTPTVRAAAPTPLGSGVAITKIGAVVSGLDVQHLNETLTELKKVAATHDFDVGTVYVVGIPLNGQVGENFGQQMLQLAARGGLLQVGDAPPDGVPVKKSPTWIVRTTKGDVLLEGFTKLSQFVAQDGTLIEPTATASEVIPLTAATLAPTPTDRQSAAELEARRKLEELKSKLP